MSADNWTVCPKCNADTWREDYEVGVYEGEFAIRYSGKCRQCGVGILFETRREVAEMLMPWDEFIKAGG